MFDSAKFREFAAGMADDGFPNVANAMIEADKEIVSLRKQLAESTDDNELLRLVLEEQRICGCNGVVDSLVEQAASGELAAALDEMEKKRH